MSDFFKDFMSDVPRGDTERFLRQQSVPQAQWMKPSEIASSALVSYDPRNPGKKILIGALGDKLIGIEDDRHIQSCAGSRAGKSVGLVSNLFFYPGSVLATDPKGELAEKTATRRAALGQKVYILDPFGTVAGPASHYRASYNPMSILKVSSETFLEDAALLADSMVVSNPDAKDPHWDESAKNFIEGVIAHVATAAQHNERRDLMRVRDLLKRALFVAPDKSGKGSPVLFQEMIHNGESLSKNPNTEAIGESIIGAAYDFYTKAENERAGVLSTVNRHSKFLDYPAFRKVLKSHDFDLAELKTNPAGVSLYLTFPALRVELSRRFLRIFVNQFLDAMEREKTAVAVPVLACLDEFPVLGYMRQFETAAGQIASFGVKLWTVLQDWSQGKSLYGDRWETFAANSGVTQFFGNVDLTTTEYVSKRLGRTQVEVARSNEVGMHQRNDGMSGRSDSIELFDLLTPDEVSRQFARADRLKRQLVLWAGRNPMMLQRVEYFDKKGPLAKYLR